MTSKIIIRHFPNASDKKRRRMICWMLTVKRWSYNCPKSKNWKKKEMNCWMNLVDVKRRPRSSVFC